jgi:hypothetical protein
MTALGVCGEDWAGDSDDGSVLAASTDADAACWSPPVCVIAATVAATALSTVAAISVDDGAGAAGNWLQLAARTSTAAIQRARNVRIVNSFLQIVYL